jgi:DNA primase
VSRIPDDVIEQIRDAADLIDLLGRHVELKRSGSDYRGPCPFHGGTHRNFAVIPRKGMYYCFVCHAAGDVFTFYMRHLGMDYPSAVREVAAQVGVTIPESREAAGPDPREPLFEAVAAAAEWYTRQLSASPEADGARRHLESRGYRLEQVLPFGLGYAPRGKAFLEAMARLGIAEELLVEAGLAQRRDDGGPIVPRMRGRLVFPIHDLRGRVVAFGGRVLGDREPKYLNSPDSPIFHKGRVLYHLHSAKRAIRQAERAIVVEGYFDVLRLVVAGLDEVVAPLGTGLTSEQATLISRYTKQVLLLYDNDAAGLRATFRAGDVLLSAGVRVSVATLPDGEDPDSLVAGGGLVALQPVLRDALDLLERKVQILERRGWLESLQGRRRALDRLLPTLRAARDPITRELYLDRVAAAVGMRVEALAREEAGAAAKAPTSRSKRASRAAEASPAAPSAPVAGASVERLLVGLMTEGEPWHARVIDAVSAADFHDGGNRELFEALAAGDDPVGFAAPQADAYELARQAIAGWDPDTLFDAAVTRLRVRSLERRLGELDGLIPLAPGDEQLALVEEKRRLTSELRGLDLRYKVARPTGEGQSDNQLERRGSASRS